MSSFSVLPLESASTEPLSGSQGGTLKTRPPGEESGASSDYLEEESASTLDCAHPTPHNIWGSFFRILIRDAICIINIFRLNCKWHICSPSPPPWQTMCYKHSFFSSVNTWCPSFACCFSHFPPWGSNNPVWPVPVWSHPFCLQCSNQIRTCLRQLPILTGYSAWVLNLGFLKMLPKGFKRGTNIFEVLGEYTCVCTFWGEGSFLPFEFRWVFMIQKTVQNHMLHDFTHMKV